MKEEMCQRHMKLNSSESLIFYYSWHCVVVSVCISAVCCVLYMFVCALRFSTSNQKLKWHGSPSASMMTSTMNCEPLKQNNKHLKNISMRKVRLTEKARTHTLTYNIKKNNTKQQIGSTT